MKCHGSIEHKPRNEEKTWTTVPRTMSGGFNGGRSHRVTGCVTTGHAEPLRETDACTGWCNGVPKPEGKPEVYRYRCCVGWCMFLLSTSCKSLFQVHVNGQKGCDTGNPNAVEIQIRLEVYTQHIDADSQCARGSIRLLRNVKNELSNETRSCGDHCASLDTELRRRREQRRTIVCVFKERDALWVYEDGGARDPSV